MRRGNRKGPQHAADLQQVRKRVPLEVWGADPKDRPCCDKRVFACLPGKVCQLHPAVRSPSQAGIHIQAKVTPEETGNLRSESSKLKLTHLDSAPNLSYYPAVE